VRSSTPDPGAHLRVHRNFLFFVVPIALFTLSLLLLAWSILRLDLPASFLSRWPWKVQLLDVQSATTVATITGGLVFARAQYATSVRPMISWTGRVVKMGGFSSKLVRVVRVMNGSTYPAVFHTPRYRVFLRGARVQRNGAPWLSRAEAIDFLAAAGLIYRKDYDLKDFGPRFPMSNSSQGVGIIALFTVRSMSVIDDVLIEMSATDQAGDTHQRVIFCLLGADRNPRIPTLDLCKARLYRSRWELSLKRRAELVDLRVHDRSKGDWTNRADSAICLLLSRRRTAGLTTAPWIRIVASASRCISGPLTRHRPPQGDRE
jgi:hypothetical protein